jgi:hypothetical protein
VLSAAGARGNSTGVPIPDSAKALKQQLNEMLKAARHHRSDQLRAMIRDFEIPDAESWYPAHFGADGSQLDVSYKKNLSASERWLENQMAEYIREGGVFSVKKQRAKKAYEMVTAPDVLLAAWERTSTHGIESSEDPIGYFVFVDGRFRWESTLKWVIF